MQPKVSVIIPVYNVEKYLCECLDSVISQTLRDIEIICVDDGSTDDSSAILDEYCKRDDRIILLSQTNAGAGVARNYGIRKARGEFVTFLDSDDYYMDPTALEMLYNSAKKNNVLVCGGLRKSLGRDGQISDHMLYRKVCAGHFLGVKLLYSDYQHDYHYHNYLFNRKMIIDNDIQFPNVSKFQDPPFFIRAMYQAKEYYVLPVEFYCYRIITPPPVQWSKRKIYDVIVGLCSNLSFSREHDLALLHWITAKRINDEYSTAIVKSIGPYNRKILAQLMRANDLLDAHMIDSVQDAGIPVERLEGILSDFETMTKEHDGTYLLEPLRQILLINENGLRCCQNKLIELQKNLETVQNELAATRASFTYRIGRFITWLPRKVRNGRRCLKKGAN